MGMLDKTKAKAEQATREFNEKMQVFLLKADEMKPDTASQEDYDKLIAAVKEATERNESVAQFETRVMKLGEGVVQVAKSVGLMAVA